MAGFYLELKWKEEETPLSIYQYGNLLFLTEYTGGEAVLEFCGSFSIDGIYYFLSYEVEGMSDLAEEMAAIYQSHFSKGLRFLWINESEGVRELYGMYGVHEGNGFRISHSTTFWAGTGALTIEAGVRIACGASCFLLAPEEGSGYSCRIGKLMTSPLQGALEITAGDGPAGSFCFQVKAEKGSNGADILEEMDAGVRFSCRGDEIQDHFQRALTGYKGTYRTLLLYGEEDIVLDCKWNPASLYHPEYTCFSIKPGTRFQSYLSNWVGQTFDVVTGEHSILVFEQSVKYLFQKNGRMQTKPYTCLGFGGEYQLIPSERTGGEWLLCGLGGTEFADLEGTDHRIRFVPGQSGFLGEAGLESLTSTSYVIYPQHAAYICQPKKAPFFSGISSGELDFFPTPSFYSGSQEPVLPFFLYQAVQLRGTGAITQRGLEEILCEERMKRIPISDSELLSGEKKLAVTPQGLMVQIEIAEESAGHWEWIGLAQTKEKVSSLPDIRFTDIASRMRQDFQEPDMMILYENKEELMNQAGVSPEFGFSVDGWSFLLKPEEWWSGPEHEEKTVLILKYGTSKSIKEWIGDSSVIQRSVRAAHEADCTPKEDYREILSVVEDPLFQGIIFLNCPVEVNRKAPGFVKEFDVILDSVQEENLCAHHLILYQSRMNEENGMLSMGASKISALLDYGQDGKITYSRTREQEPYQFTTRKFLLKVQEGRIVKAESLSELMISRFFESLVIKAEGTQGYSLVILGELQEVGELKEFLYRLSVPGEFTLKGSAVQSISVDSVTMSVKENGCDFFLGGRLFFILNEKGDVFSYGYVPENAVNDSEGIQAAPGLRYSGLQLIKAEGRMEMAYEAVCIDAQISLPRPNGFADCFPAVPVRLLTGLVGVPDDRGFVSMTAPLIQGKVSAPWFGIEYEILLGSMGALAEETSLSVQLLFAWSPGEETPLCYAGMKLPGGQIRLQGIFDMGYSSLSLRVDQSGSKHLYTLILNQFAIRVMGLSFPKGENRLYLTAGPDGKTLGWYAYYKEDAE